jgi:Sortase domain
VNSRALLLLIAGAACLTTFGVAACRAATPPDVGGPTVTALASAAPTLSAAEDAPPADEVAPRTLRIPALKLDATVSAAGVDPATGDFAVPPSVDRVGWYKFGPGATATTGSIVVAGHVDSAAQGQGAFFRLGSLKPGDRIYLDRRVFTVVARERYAKTAIPLKKYFARDGAVRLTLITCGGRFDPKTRHYQDNVVVTATPV